MKIIGRRPGKAINATYELIEFINDKNEYARITGFEAKHILLLMEGYIQYDINR